MEAFEEKSGAVCHKAALFSREGSVVVDMEDGVAAESVDKRIDIKGAAEVYGSSGSRWGEHTGVDVAAVPAVPEGCACHYDGG